MFKMKHIREATEFIKFAKKAKKYITRQIKKFKAPKPIKLADLKCFDSYAGQVNLIESIKSFLMAAEKSNNPMEHILLHGPAGYGKSTIAKLTSQSINSNIYELSGPMMNQSRLVDLCEEVEFGDVVFIDEIHALKKNVEETMYEIMQDFSLEGEPVRRFTLIGATTRPGALLKPLRDRFTYSFRLQPYSEDDLLSIVSSVARSRRVRMTKQAALAIVGVSRGIPRLVKQHTSIVLTAFSSMGYTHVTDELALNILKRTLGMYSDGLAARDLEYLKCIASNGGQCGIKNIATSLEEGQNDLTDSIEPYLVKNGFVEITSKGRKITKLGLTRIKT